MTTTNEVSLSAVGGALPMVRLDELAHHHREALLAGHLHLSLPRLGPLLRHALPRLIEAVVLPLAVLFTVGSIWGLYPAILTGLVLVYSLIAWRTWRARQVPVVLAISAASLTVRAALLMTTGQLWLYYAGPVAISLTIAAAFVASALQHRPLTRQVACEFVPGLAIASEHPALARCLRHIAFVWAASCTIQAVLTVTLIATLPTWSAVAWRSMLMPAVSGSAIAASVTLFLVALHRGGLRPVRTASRLPWRRTLSESPTT